MEKDKSIKIYLANKDGSIKPHQWFTSNQLDKITGLNGAKYQVYRSDLENDFIKSSPPTGVNNRIKTTRFKLMMLEINDIN
jgi:hypothetical protein